MTKHWSLWMGLRHTTREDQFVSYNDYSQDKLTAGVRFRRSRVRVVLSGSYWERDYPRAFAFDNPVAGNEQSNGLEARLRSSYDVGEGFSLWGEIERTRVRSNDARLEYRRTQTLLGVRWVH